MAAISVLPSRERDLRREQTATSAYHQAVMGTARASTLEQMLAVVLDSCAVLGYGCSAVILLGDNGSTLEGRLFLPQNFSDRWTRPWLAAGGETGILSWPLGCVDSLVVSAFRDHLPQVSSGVSGLLPPVTRDNTSFLGRFLGINCTVVLPLVTGEKCLGALVICSTSDDPDPTFDLATLAVLGSIAALSIERAKLQEELREREQQVSLLLKATIDAQEEERERICLEIHDGVAQTLAPAFQYLQTLDSRSEVPDTVRNQVRKASLLVRNAIREARDVIATLRPAALDTLGLVATLRYELDELRSQTGWQIEVEADRMRFPKTLETALYRILREAITNITKHAHARRVRLVVREAQGRISAIVEDDGEGFDLNAQEQDPHRKRVGLLSMRKRTELLGGTFSLESSIGQGTRVLVDVPMRTCADRRDQALQLNELGSVCSSFTGPAALTS